MPVYVFRGGRMVDKATGEPMLPEGPREGPFPCPMTFGDIEPYRSPVDGRYVSGRRAKRDDLKRTGCVDAADLPSPTQGRFRNRRFAEKRGLTHLLKEEARD